MIDLVLILGQVYDRLATTSDGAAARALLGSPQSVIPFHQLLTIPRPARVLAVFRPGGVPGVPLTARRVASSWYLYDDPPLGTARIDAVITALTALYIARSIPWCHTRVTFVSAPFTDAALDLTGRRFDLSTTQRG